MILRHAKLKLLSIGLILIASLMTSCAAESSRIFPPLKEYSRESQIKVLSELTLLPPGAETREYLKDYNSLRDQIRASQ